MRTVNYRFLAGFLVSALILGGLVLVILTPITFFIRRRQRPSPIS